MKILVLGGAGFGGSGTVRRLAQKNYNITVLDVVAPRHAEQLFDLIESGKINYIWKSTADLEVDDVKGHEIILDFAAQADVPLGFSSPIHTASTNILGIYKLMECVKRTQPKKILYMGSGTTFGPNVPIPIDETAPQYPANPYSASKKCAEIVLQAYHRAFDIPYTIMRNGIVYGEHMRWEIVVAKFIVNALLDKPLLVEGGAQTRDLNYVSNTIDAIEAVVEADEDDITGEIFHCATGTETSMEQLAKLIVELTNSSSEIVYKEYRPGEKDVRQRLDITKAEQILGYQPKVFLKQGLKNTINWFKEELQRLQVL